MTHLTIQGARRVAGRLARKVSGRGGEEGGGNDVQQVRARLRRVRARLKASQDEVASLKAELRATRDSLRHPFPGFQVDDRVRAVIGQVRDEKLTYLSEKNLEALAVMVAEADRAGRPGLVVEAGTALGGSAIVMAAAKSPERTRETHVARAARASLSWSSVRVVLIRVADSVK